MIKKRTRSLHKLEARMGGLRFFGPEQLKSRAARAGSPGVSTGKQKIRRGRQSEYGKGLQECRKVEEIYGALNRKKLDHKVRLATKNPGDTMKNLFSSLERMLVAIVHNSWTPSPYMARQLVGHNHILVNNEKVDRYSYVATVGDIISLGKTMKNNVEIERSRKIKSHKMPSYLQMSEDGQSCTLLREPSLEEVPYNCRIDFKLLIEFFNR